MRIIRSAAAFLLIAAFVLGFTGCKKTLSREAFIAEIESYGVKKTDKIDLVLTITMRRGGVDYLYYAADDEEKAKELSNLFIDRFDELPDIDAKGFVLAALDEKGSDNKKYITSACYLTFPDGKKAQDAYKILVEAYGDEEEGKKGTRSGITYCVDSSASAAGTNKIGTGVYLQDNTVFLIRTQSSVNDSYKFADRICGRLGLLSPSEAG